MGTKDLVYLLGAAALLGVMTYATYCFFQKRPRVRLEVTFVIMNDGNVLLVEPGPEVTDYDVDELQIFLGRDRRIAQIDPEGERGMRIRVFTGVDIKPVAAEICCILAAWGYDVVPSTTEY